VQFKKQMRLFVVNLRNSANKGHAHTELLRIIQTRKGVFIL